MDGAKQIDGRRGIALCTTTEGTRLGVLRAHPPWHRTPHSLTIRSAINAMVRNRRFTLANGADTVAAFMEFVETNAHSKLPIHPSCSRYWLGQLDHATDESAIAAMLIRGGAQAQEAWNLLVWWRAVRSSDFRSNPCLASPPFWLALDSEIPTGLGCRLQSKAGETDTVSVHLWLVRRIGAAGLLAFWRAVRDAALQDKPPALVLAAKLLPLKRQEPEWSMGITSQQGLVLCIEHAKLA